MVALRGSPTAAWRADVRRASDVHGGGEAPLSGRRATSSACPRGAVEEYVSEGRSTVACRHSDQTMRSSCRLPYRLIFLATTVTMACGPQTPPRVVGEPRIGDTAPDSVPAWFRDPANSIDCEGSIAGPCLRNVVTLAFKRTATPEEKQAALDAVGGVVVGGSSGSIYYVKVPGDSTTTASLLAAMARLRTLPQVELADPYSTIPVTTNDPRPD